MFNTTTKFSFSNYKLFGTVASNAFLPKFGLLINRKYYSYLPMKMSDVENLVNDHYLLFQEIAPVNDFNSFLARDMISSLFNRNSILIITNELNTDAISVTNVDHTDTDILYGYISGLVDSYQLPGDTRLQFSVYSKDPSSDVLESSIIPFKLNNIINKFKCIFTRSYSSMSPFDLPLETQHVPRIRSPRLLVGFKYYELDSINNDPSSIGFNIFQDRINKFIKSNCSYTIFVKIRYRQDKFAMCGSQFGWKYDNSVSSLLALSNIISVLLGNVIDKYTLTSDEVVYVQLSFREVDKRILTEFSRTESVKESTTNISMDKGIDLSNIKIDSHLIPISVDDTLGKKLRLSINNKGYIDNVAIDFDGIDCNFMDLIREKANYLPKRHKHHITDYDSTYKFYYVKLDKNTPYYVLAITSPSKHI